MFAGDCSSGFRGHGFFPVKEWKPANYGSCEANTSATVGQWLQVLIDGEDEDRRGVESGFS